MQTSVSLETRRTGTDGRRRRQVVMKAVHDHVFEPWDMEDVFRCVGRIKALTLELRDERRVRERVDADPGSRAVHDHRTLGQADEPLALRATER